MSEEMDNGNQTHEENNTEQGQDSDKETVALSVQGESSKGNPPLKLQLQQHTKLPGQRPVEASHLRVVETYSSVGSERPIVSSTMEVAGMLTISGKRPIAASHLQVSDTYIMGNRPVAPNDVDDPAGLMGYLD